MFTALLKCIFVVYLVMCIEQTTVLIGLGLRLFNPERAYGRLNRENFDLLVALGQLVLVLYAASVINGTT
jgi:hypothetical protein